MNEPRVIRPGGSAIALVFLCLAAGTAAASPAAARNRTSHDGASVESRLPLASAVHRAEGVFLGKTAKLRRRQGYLVPNQRGYARTKQAASFARQARPTPRARPGGASPLASTVTSWTGIHDRNSAPPDTTGAVGTRRYIELVNTKFAIYGRDAVPISTGQLASMIGAPRQDFISDPQIIWDPGTKRFYYAALDSPNRRHNLIAVGFSRGASPSSSSSWCKYAFDYGRDLPDYPKLGDTRQFVVIGVNTFRPGAGYIGSDAIWGGKPHSGTRCPRSLRGGARFNLRSEKDRLAWTPVPANQTDTSSTGWLLATAKPPSLPKSDLSLFRVTRQPNGSARIQGTGRNVPVSSYDVPPNAPQQGSTDLLDTLDSRLTQAVSAIDPSQGGGQTAIWTQHTVAGGAGSEVRWYEVNVAAHSVFQSDKVSDASYHYFNAAISPDRAVSDAGSQFGNGMAIDYSRSSSASEPAIGVVSKVGANPQSGETLILSSPVPLVGFGCRHGACRWGDYSGATPDPVPPPGTPQVWMDNQWELGTSGFRANWETQNFIVTP